MSETTTTITMPIEHKAKDLQRKMQLIVQFATIASTQIASKLCLQRNFPLRRDGRVYPNLTREEHMCVKLTTLIVLGPDQAEIRYRIFFSR